MPKYEIKKVSIWSFARTTGVICVAIYVIGYFIVVAFFLVVFIINNLGYYSGAPLLSLLIALPSGILGAAIAGLALGALVALIFNLLSRVLGGLDVEIEMKE